MVLRFCDYKASRHQSTKSKYPKIKATFHLTVDDILVIDRLQSLEFSQTGKKPEPSQIVARALQLLASQHKVSGRDNL